MICTRSKAEWCAQTKHTTTMCCPWRCVSKNLKEFLGHWAPLNINIFSECMCLYVTEYCINCRRIRRWRVWLRRIMQPLISVSTIIWYPHYSMYWIMIRCGAQIRTYNRLMRNLRRRNKNFLINVRWHFDFLLYLPTCYVEVGKQSKDPTTSYSIVGKVSIKSGLPEHELVYSQSA